VRRLPLTRPNSLVHVVAERLRMAIVNAELGLGEALSEEALASAFGVSRTPVREALNLLQLQGLIEIAPQRGSFVFRPSTEDIERLCEFRIVLEVSAAPFAAAREHASALAALEQQLALLELAFDDNDGLGYVRSDNGLHQVFFDYCGSKYFQNAYGLISSKIAAIRTNLSSGEHADQELSLGEHRQIVAYFRKNDMAPLAALLRVHIGRTQRNFLDALARGLGAPYSGSQEAYAFAPSTTDRAGASESVRKVEVVGTVSGKDRRRNR
jgi:DNA-binding GntR family transcriptional regulator